MSTLTPSDLLSMLAEEVKQTEARSWDAAAYHEEAHLQAGLVHQLRAHRHALFPVVEAPYQLKDRHNKDRHNNRCDLCVLDESREPMAWIEMKRSWSCTGPGFNTKALEQMQNLLWDVAKVTAQSTNNPADGYLAVFFYCQPGNPRTEYESEPQFRDGGQLAPADACRQHFATWFEKYSATTATALWNDIREALALPKPLRGPQLLPLYCAILDHIGEVESMTVEAKPEHALAYTLVVGRVGA